MVAPHPAIETEPAADKPPAGPGPGEPAKKAATAAVRRPERAVKVIPVLLATLLLLAIGELALAQAGFWPWLAVNAAVALLAVIILAVWIRRKFTRGRKARAARKAATGTSAAGSGGTTGRKAGLLSRLTGGRLGRKSAGGSSAGGGSGSGGRKAGLLSRLTGGRKRKGGSGSAAGGGGLRWPWSGRKGKGGSSSTGSGTGSSGRKSSSGSGSRWRIPWPGSGRKGKPAGTPSAENRKPVDVGARRAATAPPRTDGSKPSPRPPRPAEPSGGSPRPASAPRPAQPRGDQPMARGSRGASVLAVWAAKSLLKYGQDLKREPESAYELARRWNAIAAAGEQSQPTATAVTDAIRQAAAAVNAAAELMNQAGGSFNRNQEADRARYETPRKGSHGVESKADVQSARRDL